MTVACDLYDYLSLLGLFCSILAFVARVMEVISGLYIAQLNNVLIVTF